MQLLMASADTELREMMGYWLRTHGYNVLHARDEEQALRRWQYDQPELALLDADLPPGDGFAVCRQMIVLRDTSLILFLGRSSHEHEDEARALDAGAAAYLNTPFSPGLLLAHLRALARRAATTASLATGSRPADAIIQSGAFLLDGMRHEVTCERGHVRLTPIESRLLHVLMTNAGQVLPAALLVERVWGYSDVTDGVSLVKTHIRHLRQKLELEPGAPQHIVTVPASGYSYVPGAPPETRQQQGKTLESRPVLRPSYALPLPTR